MASEIPPFAIDNLVQPYLRPDNADSASKRITKALGLMFRCQLATPDRKKWEDLERLVVPVRGKRGRYRLYGRGFYKDEGVEISWTPAHEREIAQTLGYGGSPPWHDMPTNLPRILYPPGRFTEEHLRQIREEERKKQTQRDEAHPIRATAVGEIAVLKAAQATGTPTTKPRYRGIQIRGLGRKRGPIARHSNSRPADQPRLRRATVNGLCTEQGQRANTPVKDHLGKRMAPQSCDVRSDWTSESSEEYTPATESSDSEWEGHDHRKRSRVACTKIEKQQEIDSSEVRPPATSGGSASQEQPNLAFALDDGSCVKCKTSTGGVMVSCDTNHKVDVWCHIECAGLDEAPCEVDPWFCCECQKHDQSNFGTSTREPLSGSGDGQARPRKIRALSARGSNTRQHQEAQDELAKWRVQRLTLHFASRTKFSQNSRT